MLEALIFIFIFILGLYYKSCVWPIKLLTACMMGLDERTKLPFELWLLDYMKGEMSSPIYYILCLQAGQVKNSLLNDPFYGWTLSGWILKIEPKWALELGWGIIRHTMGLGGFRSAQVLVLVRPIGWVVTIYVHLLK